MAKMSMTVERGGDIEAGRVVVFHPRNARFKDVTSFPQPGTLVHVFVQPFFADGQMEFLDEKGQLGMKRSKKGKDPLKELD